MNLLDTNPTEKVTPWEAVSAGYLEATVKSLHHSPVCVTPKIGLQFKEKGEKTKFRLACECGASVMLPSEVIWPKAWEMFKSKAISEPSFPSQG